MPDVEKLLDALKRCLPRTKEEDIGCMGCPYFKVCIDDQLSMPRKWFEDVRTYLEGQVKT